MENQEKVFGVGDYIDHLNNTLEQESASVLGEISDLNFHQVGVFFALKDLKDGAILNCYIRPYTYKSLGFEIQAGMQIKVAGSPSIFKKYGKLTFNVKSVELHGEGAIKKAYELLKKKLEVEGLYNQKRPLPDFIERIGIITSNTAAVLGDFRKNIASHGFKLFLRDTRVQGIEAPAEIIESLRFFNNSPLNLDVIVIIRGGGSLEDLQAFNNELVAREIFASKIPTISAIGHDKDVPISSLVADHSTSTPTAACILVNRTWEKLESSLNISTREMIIAFQNLLQSKYDLVGSSVGRLVRELSQIFEKHKESAEKIASSFERMVFKAMEKVTDYEKILKAVNPENNLALGYSIVFDKDNKVVKDKKNIKIGDTLEIKLSNGEILSRAENIK